MSYLKEVVLKNYKPILKPAEHIKYLTYSCLFKEKYSDYARIQSAHIKPLKTSSFTYSFGMKNNTSYKTIKFNPKYDKHNYPELYRPLRYIKRLYFDNVKIFDDFYMTNYTELSIYRLLLPFILFEVDSIYEYYICTSLKNIRLTMKYIKERFAEDKSYIVVPSAKSLIELIRNDANKNEYSKRFLELYDHDESNIHGLMNSLFTGMEVVYNDTKYKLFERLIKEFGLSNESSLNIISYIHTSDIRKIIQFLKLLDNNVRKIIVDIINKDPYFSSWRYDILIIDYDKKKVLLFVLKPSKNSPRKDNTQIFKIGDNIIINPSEMILSDDIYYYNDISNIFAYFDKTTVKVMDLTDLKMLLTECKLQMSIYS